MKGTDESDTQEKDKTTKELQLLQPIDVLIAIRSDNRAFEGLRRGLAKSW